jgi:hypothetical protein
MDVTEPPVTPSPSKNPRYTRELLRDVIREAEPAYGEESRPDHRQQDIHEDMGETRTHARRSAAVYEDEALEDAFLRRNEGGMRVVGITLTLLVQT